jgi:ATP-dependent Clp protease ATP-binding subunit ClpC
VTERQRLLSMADFLQQRVVAHDSGMARIASVIQRNFAGFASKRPMGSFLILGPTGVGKTEAARVLADFLFASRDSMTRIDMSEYMDAHSVSRLIGAPPGYVGHDDGGQLTEAVRRRPYQVLLFDEVEKAAGEVLNVLLQLLEEGELTDGRGRRVRFRHTVVIMTSNLGAQHFDQRARKQVGFGSRTIEIDREAEAIKSARKAFSPELWNRIDEKMVFRSLQLSDVERIAVLLLADSAKRLEAERQITFVADASVIPLLIERGGFDKDLGARPMRRVVQTVVEAAVAAHLLEQDISPGTTLNVTVQDGEIAVV